MDVRTRRDGAQTRERLLEAATEAFARRGFRDATTAAICRHAKANGAAINYHFGGKQGLYVEVWRQAVASALSLRPPDGGVSPGAPPATRLRARVRALLDRMVGDHVLGRLVLHELIHPTHLIDDVRRELVAPQQEATRAILRELLGPRATERDVALCELSVVNQVIAFRLKPLHLNEIVAQDLQDGALDELAEHITRFSLAGIREARIHIDDDRREP